MIRKGYRYLLTAIIAASAAALLTFAARNDFGLGRNMEITVNMMRELSLGYVDPIDPDRLMEGAAAGMVSSALEVFFTISASLLVRQLWLRRRGFRLLLFQPAPFGDMGGCLAGTELG